MMIKETPLYLEPPEPLPAPDPSPFRRFPNPTPTIRKGFN